MNIVQMPLELVFNVFCLFLNGILVLESLHLKRFLQQADLVFLLFAYFLALAQFRLDSLLLLSELLQIDKHVLVVLSQLQTCLVALTVLRLQLPYLFLGRE